EPLEPREVPTAAGIYALGGGPGGPPRVQVYDTATGVKIADFLAYEPTFTGGVNAAIGDVTNDGVPDLIVGAGVGGGPRVRVLDGGMIATQRLAYTSFGPTDAIADFFAGDPNTRAGLFVTTADYNGDGVADVAVGTGPGLPGAVTIYSGAVIRSRR